MAGVVFLSGQDVSLVTPHFPLGDVEPVQSAAVVGESDCGGIPAHAAIHIQHHRPGQEGEEREMFYLTTHSTHFIYGYMASDIWLRTILIVRKETRYRHIGYSF